MIPIIGLIVAIYTVVRMIDISTRQPTPIIVRVFCVVGVLATLFLSASLMMSGSSVSRPPY